MSELSESEKRRILRERRQKKFSSGGGSSRLNKITGQANSLMSTESSLDSRERTPERSSSNLSGTSRTEELTKGNVKEQPENDPQISILKHLADDERSTGENGADLVSMFQSMVGGENSGQGLGQPAAPVNQELLDYHNYLVNRLKAWSIVIKWGILLPYIYLVTHFVGLSLPQWLVDSSNFFSIFVGFEIVATSVYYSRLRSIEKGTCIDTIMQNNMIAKVVSLIPEQGPTQSNLKSYVYTLLQYWDVVSMLITDVCFVLIVLGVFSYM